MGFKQGGCAGVVGGGSLKNIKTFEIQIAYRELERKIQKPKRLWEK